MRPGYRFVQGVLLPFTFGLTVGAGVGPWRVFSLPGPVVSLTPLGAVRTRVCTMTVVDDGVTGFLEVASLDLALVGQFNPPGGLVVPTNFVVDEVSAPLFSTSSGDNRVLQGGSGSGNPPWTATVGRTVRLGKSTVYGRDLSPLVGGLGGVASVAPAGNLVVYNSSTSAVNITITFSWSYEIWEEPYLS